MSVGRDQIETLQHDRRRSLEARRKFLEGLGADSSALTPEQRQTYDRHVAEYNALGERIQLWQEQAAAEKEAGNLTARVAPDPVTPEQAAAVQQRLGAGLVLAGGLRMDPNDPFASQAYNDAFGRFLTKRMFAADRRVLAQGVVGGDEPGFGQQRADLVSDSDVDGGALIAPRQVVAEVIKEMDDVVLIRRWARKFQVRQARSLGAPKRTSRASTFGWSAEIQAPTKDTSLKFGGRELNPHYLSGEVMASRDFLRNAMISADEIIRGEISRDAGEVEEDGFLLGSGDRQPLGVYVPDAQGIPDTRDVACANSTKVVIGDFVKLRYDFKAQYIEDPSFRLLTSRKAIQQISEQREDSGAGAGTGGYMWEPSVRAEDPDRIKGMAIHASERNPNTFTTGKYVAIGGAWRWYWIADALEMQIQRLVEIAARENMDSFLVRLKVDGMPVLDEAFRRLKLA